MAQPDPYSSSRPDGKWVATAAQFQSRLKSRTPELAFDPHQSPDQFPSWKAQVRRKLEELLAFPEIPIPREVHRTQVESRDGYTLEKWELTWGEQAIIPFLLLVPDGITPSRPGPAVLCFPGSGRTKENLAGEPELDDRPVNRDWKWEGNCMALHFVKAGFIALSVDNPAFGESASRHLDRNDLSLSLIWEGWSYEGLATFQAALLLHGLAEDPRVQRSIAASGHSLGAKYADFLGLLYPDRICAVIHNDFIGNWRERMIALNGAPRPPYQIIPGFFRWFDYTDLLAALAPVPVLFSEGGRSAYLEKITSAYQSQEAEDSIAVYHYDQYDTPEKRSLDQTPIPEGITMEEYFPYVNVDPAYHVFRPHRAIPWLKKILVR